MRFPPHNTLAFRLRIMCLNCPCMLLVCIRRSSIQDLRNVFDCHLVAVLDTNHEFKSARVSVTSWQVRDVVRHAGCEVAGKRKLFLPPFNTSSTQF